MLPSLALLLASCTLPGLAPGAASDEGAVVHAAARWGADYFPDVELTTHEGRRVRFFDDLVRGKVVVINFFYTSCPDACPLETARLVEVQDILGERVGHDVFLYSISIDPARDTVAALASYAERFQVGPGWLFLRGSAEDVTLLREKLGVLGAGETELKDHSLSLVIGNQATGRWMRRSPFENAHVLADEIGSWLHNWKTAPTVEHDYSEAPELRSISRGESLFRTRCSACHAIGPGDGVVRVGPNLQGVTRWRERAWLERWIREPDRMLAEGDELALALFEAYRRVPMPNMRLNALEATALIEFIEEETVRTLATPEHQDTPPKTPPACCAKLESLVLSSDPPPAAGPDPIDAPPAGPLAPPTPRPSARTWLLLGLLATLLLAAGSSLPWQWRARG